MSNYKTIAGFFEERGPEDIERFVDKNLDISQQVYAMLEEKGWSQKDLAEALGKSAAEVSKWLSGSHNLTLRSIAKMEAVLEADIILTPKKAARKFKQVEYVILKAYANTNKLISGDIQYTEISGSTPVPGKQDIKTAKVA
ncbi:MAG: helix-turn-helix transcriptional regulator [Phaeodactylibacter sp.]|nr:helix-turn-helix transcriptional regulator [Phaeodactylibacter sp.]